MPKLGASVSCKPLISYCYSLKQSCSSLPSLLKRLAAGSPPLFPVSNTIHKISRADKIHRHCWFTTIQFPFAHPIAAPRFCAQSQQLLTLGLPTMIIIRHRHGQLSRRSFSPSSPRGAHRLGCFTLGAQRRAIKHLLSSSTPPPPPAPATSTAVAGCRTGFGKKGLLSGGSSRTYPNQSTNQTKPSQYDPGIYLW